LILASFVFGLYTANLFAVTQTWAGIVAPIVTGFIFDERAISILHSSGAGSLAGGGNFLLADHSESGGSTV
jgi:hypothetical protein